MKNKKESLSILIKKYGCKTAKEWVQFLKIAHSDRDILVMDKHDYYYPCWIEQIEYLVNDKEEFKLWNDKFIYEAKQERRKIKTKTKGN